MAACRQCDLLGNCVRVAVVAFTLSLLAVRNTQAIKDGVTADRCDFPDLAVAVAPDRMILCTGVFVERVLYMPAFCEKILLGFAQRTSFSVTNGTYTWTFGKGTTQFPDASRENGMFKTNLNEKGPSLSYPPIPACTKSNSFYDGSEPLDTNSCQLAGFGTAENSPRVAYSVGNLRATKVVKSTTVDCCHAIQNSLSDQEKDLAFDKNIDFNCVTAKGAPCGLADAGAPVMCNTVSGKRVTIGLTASSPCVSNGLFLIYDVTGSSTKTKFGLKNND